MTGLVHGLLFIAFVAAVVHVAAMMRWDRGRIAGALVASIVPFGTFVLDRRLRDDQSRVSGGALAAGG